jgi:beta-galactosidase
LFGRKKKGALQYRLRWDDVVYEPGEVRVVAYKNGKTWANDSVETAGEAVRLLLAPDRSNIAADGKDLSFVTLTIADKKGRMVPGTMHEIHFEISGPGEIVATDNGNPTDMTAFPSKDRKAFNGLALAIVRSRRGVRGRIVVTAKSDSLQEARTTIATSL